MSNILIADDDDLTRELVAATLETAGHAVRAVENGTLALEAARAEVPDMMVLDYRMGEPDGLEVCRQVKATPRMAHVPVLILTGEGRLEDRLDGFDAGADDYLPKPFDHRELLARAQALLHAAQRGLERNPSSGLPGGAAIDAEFARRRAAGDQFAVCYLDFDNFKPFGERFGFSVSDALIRDLGDILRQLTAETEAFAGHVGGDDFVVICSNPEARTIAEQAQRELEQVLPRHIPVAIAEAGVYRGVDRAGTEREFPLTRISAAIVRVDPERWTSAGALGEAVSDAKRRAKTEAEGGIFETDLS